MKIAFLSNFLNHHQVPLCEELYGLLGDGFTFVATERLPAERSEMGYRDLEHAFPWAASHHGGDRDAVYAERVVRDADVVVMGDAPESLLRLRHKSAGVVLRYSERPFKQGRWRVLDPRVLSSLIRTHAITRGSPAYLLSAGAFAAGDYRMIGAYRNRAFKWGYFPEFREHCFEDLWARKEEGVPEILWVGRFVKFKRPDHALRVADRLTKAGIDFRLSLIGTGPLRRELTDMVSGLRLESSVRILGPMDPDSVRSRMESARVLLVTSDQGEGWGAVVNEGMNSGCAIVGSHLVGSIPYLVQHGANGLAYPFSDIDSATQLVMRVLSEREFARRLGFNAYETIAREWCPRVAATRLVSFCQGLLDGGQAVSFSTGPLSIAS